MRESVCVCVPQHALPPLMPPMEPKDLAVLPNDVWRKILDPLDANAHFSFAMACRPFREVQQAVKPKDPEQDKTVIDMRELGYLGDEARFKVSGAWIRWAYEEMGTESYVRTEHRR